MKSRNGQPAGSEDYRPGFKNPPKQHQFKPGHSGNPAGRPKKKANFADGLLSEFLGESTYMLNGKRVKLPHILAIVLKTRTAALRGDMRAAEQYMKFAKMLGLIPYLNEQLKSAGQTTLRVIYVDGPGPLKPVVRT